MKIKAHLVRRAPGRSRRNGVMTGEVAKTLRRAIFQGEFQPGEPLPELHLARRFGVSQAIIREAFSWLGHSGLVRRFPNKGTFVTSLTPEEISQHVRLRLMLETAASLDAAGSADSADWDALDRKVSAMGAAAASGDYFELAQADLDFRREIWRISGDATLARLLDQITLPLFAFVSMRRSQRHEDLSYIVPEHAAIVATLRRGKRSEISLVVRQQIERSYRGFLQSPMGLEHVLDWREESAEQAGAR
jgi:DNA-binding GntR family transcriptional regulator